MALPAQKLLLLLGGLLIAAFVVGGRLVRIEDPQLAALDAAPVDDETPDAEEEEAVKAAAKEPTEDWSKVSRRLVV